MLTISLADLNSSQMQVIACNTEPVITVKLNHQWLLDVAALQMKSYNLVGQVNLQMF